MTNPRPRQKGGGRRGSASQSQANQESSQQQQNLPTLSDQNTQGAAPRRNLNHAAQSRQPSRSNTSTSLIHDDAVAAGSTSPTISKKSRRASEQAGSPTGDGSQTKAAKSARKLAVNTSSQAPAVLDLTSPVSTRVPELPMSIVPTVANSRRKPRTRFALQSSRSIDTTPMSAGLKSAGVSTPSPLIRTIPQPAAQQSQQQKPPIASKPPPLSSAAGQARFGRDGKLKSYTIDPPSSVQPYPFKDISGKELKETKFPDFFPWKGNHIEDVVSENTARNGSFDKLAPGANEHMSGRQVFGPIFKQKAGLAHISSLFLTVLEKRQFHGRITGPSTFKPPPRVAFTALKREGWMKELASPSSPLRKLSRTIPHGIRGRDLLDECLAKRVPTSRAVWFVRCVGANELRGLKRKGAGALSMGNEMRWIRDWTNQVTQFLEKELTDCGKDIVAPKAVQGKPDNNDQLTWRCKMLYTIQLTTHLYSENLVDRGVFLDWYLGFWEGCSLDRLPLAFLLLQNFWDQIVSFRKYGHRLAEALLSKVALILEAGDEEMYLSLMRRLSSYITTLVVFHRESLIIPKSWPRYRNVLPRCVDRKNELVESCLQNVVYRNENLLFDKSTKKKGFSSSAQATLVQAFDALEAPFDLDILSVSLLSLCPDRNLLVRTLCEWTVTSLRVGTYRIYLATRILRRWTRHGIQIQEAIHDVLLSVAGDVETKRSLYLLVCELVRSKHFSLGKYMTWLISRGALMRCTAIDKDQPAHIRLLAEIPVLHSSTPTSQRNLRANLLSQKGISPEEERSSLLKAKTIVSMKIGGLFDRSTPSPDINAKFSVQELGFLRSLNRSVMSELGFWVFDAVRHLVVEGIPLGRTNWRDLTVEVGISAVTLPQFLLIRKVFEEFEDFGLLAEVMKSIANADSPAVLSSAADTLNYHFDTFSALGCVQDILKLLFSRYKKLQVLRMIENKVMEPYLSISLRDLAMLPGCDVDMRKSLEDDVINSQPAIIALSPISDMMIDNLQAPGSDINEEMERLLANGTSIDKNTLARLFQTLISQLEGCYGDSGQQQMRIYASFLARLRQRDKMAFDELAKIWIMKLIRNTSRPSLEEALAHMFVAGCVELATAMDLLREHLAKADENSGSIEAAEVTELAFQALDLVVDSTYGLQSITDQELYTLRLKKQAYRKTHAQEFVYVFRKAIQFCAIASEPVLEKRLFDFMTSRTVMDMLRSLATAKFDELVNNLINPLSKTSNPALSKSVNLLIDHLLDDHDSNDLTEVDADVRVSKLLQSANEFSIRLCQLKLRLIFDTEIASGVSPGGGESTTKKAVTKTFVEGITHMFKERSAMWSDLVSVLDAECASQIRLYAEELFLNSPSFPKAQMSSGPLDAPPSDDGQVDDGVATAKSFLSVLEATAGSVSSPGPVVFPPILADKINLIVQALPGGDEEPAVNSSGSETGMPARETDPVAEFRDMKYPITLFLRIVSLHRTEFYSSKVGNADPSRMIVGLCALLMNKHIASDDLLFELVLDTTASLIDDASDEVRLLARRYVRKKNVSQLINYLLGGFETTSSMTLGATPASNAGSAVTWYSNTSAVEWLKGLQRGKLVDYPLKPWEKLSDPTPFPGDNDTSLSLTLFSARKVVCKPAVVSA